LTKAALEFSDTLWTGMLNLMTTSLNSGPLIRIKLILNRLRHTILLNRKPKQRLKRKRWQRSKKDSKRKRKSLNLSLYRLDRSKSQRKLSLPFNSSRSLMWL
jgi:hypothetical protein